MREVKAPLSLRELIQECERIEVPLIQRDYAQGRDSEKEVREDFLGALHGALSQAAGDANASLNLDFIYGGFESGSAPRFLPLDGQQRLTTLFLLHWYLAWRDARLSDFRVLFQDGRASRFTYLVRPSCTEFFDALVAFVPECEPAEMLSVSRLLEDQPWFFLHWRLDPTIQGALTMLDAIHARFSASQGLYSRLVDEAAPSITFHLLPLEHFGLSDDLYIKMNARGKPLTAFETFKARFEELLRHLFPTGTRRIGATGVAIPVFFERRMDTQWTDFFWAQKRALIDDAALNLVWALVRVSLEPASSNFASDTSTLADRTLVAGFTVFHDHDWLTARFADHLMDLLEAWSSGGGPLARQLPDTRYFDEAAWFRRAITSPWALTYLDLTRLAGFVAYLQRHRGLVKQYELHEWMRIVRNLAANSDIERPEEYGRSLAGLQELLPDSKRIVERFAEGEVDIPGFSAQQVREEVLKARLLLADGDWRQLIEEAEGHAYFAGQIGFLLEFCGVTEQTEELPSKWQRTQHAQLQARFRQYLTMAQIAFGDSGLATGKAGSGQHLWKRALLSVGVYLASSGGNDSFLTDQQGNWDSWKRFLRDGEHSKRQCVKSLWDRLDPSADIEPQLSQIIEAAVDLEPWRVAILRHPEVISYCKQQKLQRFGNDRVYLLSKRQMSGYHAELFSYALYWELAAGPQHELKPLRLVRYVDVYGRWSEPYVSLIFERRGQYVYFAVQSADGQFRINVDADELRQLPEVGDCLREELEFTQGNGQLTRCVPRSEVRVALQQVAQRLAKLRS